MTAKATLIQSPWCTTWWTSCVPRALPLSEYSLAASVKEVRAIVLQEYMLLSCLPTACRARQHLNTLTHTQAAPLSLAMAASTALHAALSYPARLAGVVAFSGWVAMRDTFSSTIHKANASLPVLMCNGTKDPAVRCTRPQPSSRKIQCARSHTGLRWLWWLWFPGVL